MVAEHGTVPLERQGSLYFPPPDKIIVSPSLWMIGRMIAPSARMMLPYPAAVQKNTFFDDR
jgi:hypothetical protein